jgi:hypothetical protein
MRNKKHFNQQSKKPKTEHFFLKNEYCKTDGDTAQNIYSPFLNI